MVVDIFLGWWKHGFESWQRRRAAPATRLPSIQRHSAPSPDAITGADGQRYRPDRWREALLQRDHVRALWEAPRA